MKRNPLWKISVTTSPEAEHAVAELLAAVFCQLASSYTDANTRQVTASVYLQDRPRHFIAARRELALGLKWMAREGFDVSPGGVSLEKVRREDWAESWKRHFKPLVISSALLIKPSWSRRRPRRGQAVVVLDPGLSFGTGCHATTAFCLRQLVALRRRGEAQSCLDVGTGSGILAIAAARLGYCPVDALDSDPDSIRIARDNARRNGVSAGLRFLRQDLTRLPRRSVRTYSVICANLISESADRRAGTAARPPAPRRRASHRRHPENGI